MRASLRTTTALIASLTLIVPTTLPAQTETLVPNECTDGSDQLCVDAKVEAEAGTETQEPVAGETEDPATAEKAEPVPAPTAEEPPAEEGAAEAEEPALAEPVEEVQQESPEPQEEVAPEANAPVEQSEPEEAPVEAEAEAVTEEQPTAPTAEDPEAESPEAAEVQTEQPDADAREAEAVAESDTPAPTEDARNDDTTTEAPATSERPAHADAAVTEAAETPAPAASEAAAAQEGADGEVTAEMETETVTEETARSSADDFVGEINADADASVEKKDSGLSKFEKALLVGAGALAVGAIVRGNREVIGTSQDRLVVSGNDGNLQVLKDDNALLRQPGSQIQTQTFDDGSTRTITTRADGSQVITVRDGDLRVIRRILIRTDGSEVTLIDDTNTFEPVDVSRLPPPAKDIRAGSSEDELRTALEREGVFDRNFSLAQIRQISEVRKLAPAIDVDTITFETGSAAIKPEQARSLSKLGNALSRLIQQNPNEVFLVEGHTDAVGSASTNLILSDRRAESLALAMTEYFDVPPENLVVQGYGESDLRVPTDTAERANRRAGIRRITKLMQVASR